MKYLACFHSFPGWDGTLLDAPAIVWWLIVSDFGIFLAYVVLSWGIFRYAMSSKAPPFVGLSLWFAVFIGLCGITHLVKILVLFVPAFGVEAIFQWAALVASLIAAGFWVRKHRLLVAYAEEIDALREGVQRRQAELQRKLDELEKRVP